MQANFPVILTREESDNEALGSELKRLNIPYFSYPCIRTTLVPLDKSLRVRDTETLKDYDIIVFSSRRGVSGISNAYKYLSGSFQRLAAVGESTAIEIKKHIKRDPEFIASPATAENLAALLIKNLDRSEKILHIRGNKSTGIFKNTMVKEGFEVTETEVYRNEKPDINPVKVIDDAVVVFASLSAVKGFFSVNSKELTGHWTYLAIGPTTSTYMKKIGLQNVEQADNPDLKFLLKKIVKIIHHKSLQ